MENLRALRERLQVTQAELAEGLGVTQGNVSHYERGQTIPPAVARLLIEFAKDKGVGVTFDDIYNPTPSDKAAA